MNGSGYSCPGCHREFPELPTMRLWAWCGTCRRFRRWPTRWEMFVARLRRVWTLVGVIDSLLIEESDCL